MFKSAFANDPFCVVAMVFKKLYPGASYRAQVSPELYDENGQEVSGETVFPDNGGRAEILVSSDIAYQDMIEVFAHELAHVAAGNEAEHNAAWESAFSAIHEAYMRVMEEKIK